MQSDRTHLSSVGDEESVGQDLGVTLPIKAKMATPSVRDDPAEAGDVAAVSDLGEHDFDGGADLDLLGGTEHVGRQAPALSRSTSAITNGGSRSQPGIARVSTAYE